MESKKKAPEKETKKSKEMQKREEALHIVNVAVLMAVFAGITLFMTFGSRPNVSYTENRDLEKPPEFTWDGYWSGYVTDQFAKYYNDTVPMRSTWKLVISNFRSYLGIKYNGGVTIVGQLPVIENPSKPNTSSRPANSIPAVVIPGANNSNKVPAVVIPGGNSSADNTSVSETDTESSLPYSKVPAVVIPNTTNDNNTTAE